MARERKPSAQEREAALLAAARREVQAGARASAAQPAAVPPAPPAARPTAPTEAPAEGGLAPQAAQRIALLMAQAAEEKRREKKRLRTWTLHLPAAVLVAAIAWVLWLLIGLLERTRI